MRTREVLPFALMALFTALPARVSAQANPTAGQTPAAATTAVVEGDVDLIMPTGNEKRGTGLTVVLLANPADSLAAVLHGICNAYNREKARLSQVYRGSLSQMYRAQTANERTSMGQANSAISGAVLRTTRTDKNAHYRFENVPPGEYIVRTTWKLFGRQYAWLVPVTPGSGQTLSLDLDTDGVKAGTDCPGDDLP